MVWQWLNFSWTESIKKRACRAFLNRYLGKYLDQRLELEGMTIDLANGCCSVENVRLSADALNAALDEVCAPVHVQSGVIGEVSVSIPWMSLLNQNCTVDIRRISLEVVFKPPSSGNVPGVSLTDSLLVSNEQASLDIATEVTSCEAGLPKEDPSTFDDNYGGVDALARAIQHILDRVKVSIVDTNVTVSHLSGDRQHELALRLFLHKIEFFDALTEEEPPSTESAVVQGEGEGAWSQHRQFATKILHLMDPLVEFAQSRYRMANSEGLTSHFHDVTATPVQPFHFRNEAAPTRRWSPFAMATGEVEVKLKVKQQDDFPGHKLQLEGFCSALHVLVSPQQLHGLVEMATEIASTVMSPAPPPSPGLCAAVRSRRIRPHEFARLEPQLHHHMSEDQVQVMDPFRHPLDEEDTLNHSLSDLAGEDTFYSIELSASHNLGHGYGDLPPLGTAATESTSHRTPPGSLKTKEIPTHTRFGSTPSAVTPVSHLGQGSQQSLSDEEDSVSYNVTVNVLTVSVLHCDSIGLLRQDSTSGSAEGSMHATEPLSAEGGGASSFETNEHLRQRYLKGLSAVCSRAGKGAKMEDLGGAVPTDHLLMWLSTVKWNVSSAGGKVDVDTTIGRAKVLEFLFADSVGSLSLSHLTKPISCSQVLCLAGSGVDVTSSLVPSRPCCKVKYSAATVASKKGRTGHSKTKSTRATLEVELGTAEFELDVSLVDRLETLFAPRMAECSSPPPASMNNYTSLYMGKGSGPHTIHQKRQEVFQRNLDDSSQPLSVNLCIKCQQLKLSVRFPVVPATDTSPRPHPPWLQYWREKLLFQVSSLSLQSTLGQTSSAALTCYTKCERLTGSLLHDGCPNGDQFLCVSGPEDEEEEKLEEEEEGSEGESGPEVTISWTPPTPLPPSENIPTFSSQQSATRSLGDSILDAMEQLRGMPGSTPFSSECTKHVTGVSYDSAKAESESLFSEKVLPGNAQELRDFRQEAIRKSTCRVTCRLPYLLLAFPRKDVFDIIYRRLVGDLLQSESQPSSLEPSITMATSYFSPLAPPPVSTLVPPSDSYYGSKEVFKPCTGPGEEDVSEEVNESLGQKMACQRDNLSVCRFSLHIMVTNSQVAIATDSVPLPECPQGPVEEEKLIEVEESSQSPWQQQPTSQHPLRFKCSDMDLFYCCYASSPVQHLAVQVQAMEVWQAEELVLGPAKQGYRLTDSRTEEPLLTVAMESRIPFHLNTQNKWAVLLCGATAGLLASKESWISELAHFLTLPAGTVTPTTDAHSQTSVNLFHFHVMECTVEYRPLRLPLVAVLWVEESTLSTSLVTNSPIFSFRVLLDTCCLFLSDHPSSVEPLHSGAVCVAEAGPLELLLTVRSEESAARTGNSGPELEVEFSGGQVHLMTCADSFVALRDIIIYLASDGDIGPSGCAGDTESRQQATPLSSLPSSAPVASLQMDVTDHLKEAMSDDSVGNSAIKQKGTGRRVGRVAKTPNAGIRVEFASDSDSEPGNSLDGCAVGAGLDQSSTTEPPSPCVSQICSQMSPTVSPPLFADEQEEEGFLLFDPLHTLSTDSKLLAPMVRCLLPGDEPLIAKDNHFIKPSGYVDRLQRPRSYPQPVISYTIKELNVRWQAFGGQDLTEYLPSGACNTRSADAPTVPGQRSALPKTNLKGKHLHNKPRNLREKGGVHRDHSTVVELELTKLRVQYEEYPAGAAQCSRLALLIQDVEIRDCLSVSAINKLLYQFCSDDMPQQTHANMVMFKAVFMAPEREGVPQQMEGLANEDSSHPEAVIPDSLVHQKEGVVRLSLLPVRVNLDQDTMFFLQDFFLDISLAPPPSCLKAVTGPRQQVPDATEAPRVLYIKSFVFSPDVPVRVDYVAKHIDMDKGKVAGVLGGLSHLNCLQLSLKSLHTSQGFTSWSELASFAAHQWQDDISQYQIPRMISSVGPLHYITQFVRGVVDLVWLPWQQYQEDGRMFRGLQRGASSFTSSTGSASLELASRMVAAVEGIVRFASSVTGDELSPAGHRPQGMYEGLTTAYGVMSEGVSGTVANVAQVVYDEHQSRGVAAAVGGVVRLVPRMVLRPIVHVSEATRLALTGMRNELVPSARREDNAKYKTPERP